MSNQELNALSMGEALTFQAEACRMLGSPLWGALLADLAADFEAGGITHDLLADRPHPMADAVPLRYVGAIHRLALTGAAPDLAARLPSCGGDGADPEAVTTAALAAVRANRPYVEAALGTQVQTNEVGRAALLAGGFALLARRHGLPLRTFEIGASAGLLSRWHRYAYDTGATSCGDPASPLRFTGCWVDGAEPDLSGGPEVVERHACDVNPLDITDDDARLRLLSFVWPDQSERFARLATAIDIARADPLPVERASADDWVEANLRGEAGATTVLFHSIVWQYLPRETKDRLRRHLSAEGERATPEAPLAWLRMEPAGPVADLRLTTWPGGTEEVLATAGYHGADIAFAVHR